MSDFGASHVCLTEQGICGEYEEYEVAGGSAVMLPDSSSSFTGGFFCLLLASLWHNLLIFLTILGKETKGKETGKMTVKCPQMTQKCTALGTLPKTVWQYSTFLGPGPRNHFLGPKKSKKCAKVRPAYPAATAPLPTHSDKVPEIS